MSEEKKEQFLPNKAIGIARTSDGKYNIVVIRFNADTLESGPVELFAKEDYKDAAEQRFKIETVKQGVFG